ncbi:MAG: OB-fold domain-containing protein [Chloroflexota bacterium]|nr:OB-fold domain-containing protein [Chloroflexota bacterium]
MPDATPGDAGEPLRPIEGEHLGMPLAINVLDAPNREFFGHCARRDFHLQRCIDCDLVEYPPRTACMWCGGSSIEWVPVEGRGAVYSYTEVVHAIQPALRHVAPYLILMVELDTQRGRPGPDDGVRVTGNLVTADAEYASPELVAQVGIGSRMRMVYRDAGEGIALPMWTLDEDADQPVPWRYPE